jgi:hypothetical protein
MGGGATVLAEQLAGRDKVDRDKANASDMVLNDANIYIPPGDKYASKLRHEVLTRLDYYWGITYTDAFSGTSNFMTTTSGDTQRISYCVIANLSANVHLGTTSLAFHPWTARKDGAWDEKTGLYGGKGGYVVYCDGHTVWLDGSKPAKFLK